PGDGRAPPNPNSSTPDGSPPRDNSWSTDDLKCAKKGTNLMSIADTAAKLGAAHAAATSQESEINKVVQQAEQARARLRRAAGGAANPLAERAVRSYADAVVKLREGAALLAEVTEVLAEYARAAAIDLPASNVLRLPVTHIDEPGPDIGDDDQ